MATLKNEDLPYGSESRSLDFAGDRGSNSRSQSGGSESAERIGTAVAMIVLSFALVLLVIWAESRPNFARCSAMADLDTRTVCYEELRQQGFQPPAKGANAPTAAARAELGV